MYGDYWKFSRLPFENGCDPLFFFRGRSHEAALLKLQYVVEQSKGVALLVGEHGVGKTYVSRVLESERPSAAVPDAPAGGQPVAASPVLRLMFPRLTAEEMLAYLVNGLTADEAAECPPAPAPADEVIRRLEAALRRHAESQRRPLLIVDDAHLIDSPAVLQALAQVIGLCEVRGLGLSLILAGQPELLAQVQRVPALNSRIAVRTALHPFSQEETFAYIRHRLALAGLDGCMFDDDALTAFHQLSMGFPRRINQLCDLALLVGYADGLPALTRQDVEAAADELLTVAVG